MSAPSQLMVLARKAAASQGLDPALVCAVVEQESAWNPWAMRYEPAFFTKYVASLYTNNKVSASEAYARGFSWGLMQVMGQVARESGFDALFLSALCDPEQGLAVGCKLLRKKFDLVGADTTRALLAWNGGANPTRFKFSRAARITYKPRRERSTFFSLCSGAASCATTSMAIGK